jgi:hypothetical protein
VSKTIELSARVGEDRRLVLDLPDDVPIGPVIVTIRSATGAETESGVPARPALKAASQEARAFKARWALVNAAEREELQATSLGLKLAQLAALMSSVDQLGWTESLAAEEDVVRDRWLRLQIALRD